MRKLVIQDLGYLSLGPIDLAVDSGECVCLSGPSGSGKTLMLRALADLDPHYGRVFLDGQERCTMSAPDWRRKVMLLPAESQWWAETVAEHFDSRDAKDFATLGFEPDVLSWQISRLSTGERQRLALLRMLSLSPAALLLDEPTANLDSENTKRAEKLIAGYTKRTQAAVLWVSHSREQISRVADRWLHFEPAGLQEAPLP